MLDMTLPVTLLISTMSPVSLEIGLPISGDKLRVASHLATLGVASSLITTDDLVDYLAPCWAI
jgi:hypothetical protein